MLKKSFATIAIFMTLLMMATPAMAILKVLEPDLSRELREIAANHIAQTHNVEAGAITIQDGWVRELWNIKVDVYMVEVIIDQGLATEQKLQVPVRVDQKTPLTEIELAALVEEDYSLTPAEPIARILAVAETDEAPALAENLPIAETSATNNMPFYIAAAVLIVVLGTATLLKRRSA